MKTKTNNGSLIDLPVLHPALKVGDTVAWMQITKRTLHSAEFGRRSGKVLKFNSTRTKVLVQGKAITIWINLKDLTA